MSNFFVLHTSMPLADLKIDLEDKTLELRELIKKQALYCYYPKISYKDNKEYFYWISYDMWFNPCGYPDFFEWIEKELKKANEISLFYMVDVQREDKVEEKREWEEYNSIYKKEYLKIKELIQDPDKLDFDYHIEFEFIL